MIHQQILPLGYLCSWDIRILKGGRILSLIIVLFNGPIECGPTTAKLDTLSFWTLTMYKLLSKYTIAVILSIYKWMYIPLTCGVWLIVITLFILTIIHDLLFSNIVKQETFLEDFQEIWKLRNIEEMFPQYYMHSNISCSFKSLAAQY